MMGNFQVAIGASTEKDKFAHLPPQNAWNIQDNSKYIYYCDNETINGSPFSFLCATLLRSMLTTASCAGVEFPWVPEVSKEQVLVCDMSSNFLSRPVDVSKYGVIWAGAQKNAGISGFAIVIVREDLLNRARPDTPTFISYKVRSLRLLCGNRLCSLF
jgi:phosphoserine aminotransferase